jgi:hypothetical protein
MPSQKRKGSDRLLSDSEIIFMAAVMHEKTEINNEFVNRINEIINILFQISRNSIFIYLKTFFKKMSASTKRIKVPTMQISAANFCSLQNWTKKLTYS